MPSAKDCRRSTPRPQAGQFVKTRPCRVVTSGISRVKIRVRLTPNPFENATCWRRGKQLDKKYPGHYVSPSIHYTDKFNPDSRFLSSEIFGPNCTFISYDDFDEAINIANRLGARVKILRKDEYRNIRHHLKDKDILENGII